MLNLFAYRATDPHVLKSVADPVGPDNDRHLLEVCRQAALVVCCWGADGEYRGSGPSAPRTAAGYPLARAGAHQNGPPPPPALPEGQLSAHPFRRQLGHALHGDHGRDHREVNRGRHWPRVVSFRAQSRGSVLALAEPFRQKAIGA
jgi:Protein of unknown function (DUF1643)